MRKVGNRAQTAVGRFCNPSFLSASRLIIPDPFSFDSSYLRWRAEFAPFEAECFGIVCEFVCVNFDTLLDRYYRDGHRSLNDFLAWAFERYLWKVA